MDYEAEFDAKAYLGYYTIGNGVPTDNFSFRLKQYHHFFETYSCNWNKKSSKILDFGAGPIVSNVISATPYANEIILASHTESEQRELTHWKNGADDAHEWSSFFKYVVNVLESKPEETAWKERMSLLRDCITVTSCDITLEHPIGIGTRSEETFAVVCTNLCLEAACKTYEDYKKAVKKLAKLVLLGGYLVMCVVERETFYMVSGNKWFCLYLTLSQVKSSMEEAGFDILSTERNPAPIQQFKEPVFADYTSIIFIVGLKVVR